MQEEKYYGLVLNEGETKKLKEICIRYNIPITYPELFDENNSFHPLWVINRNGIGLVGTTVMHSFSKTGIKIFHGVNELEEHLSKKAI